MSGRIHIAVDLEVDNQSIRGTTRDGHGRSAQFVGWLGLIAVVEQAQIALVTSEADERNRSDE